MGVTFNMALENNSRGFGNSPFIDSLYEGEFGGTPIVEETKQYSWNPTAPVENKDDPVITKPEKRPVFKPELLPTIIEEDTTDRGFGSSPLGEFGSAGGLGARPIDDSPTPEIISRFGGDVYEPVDFLKQAANIIMDTARGAGDIVGDSVVKSINVAKDSVQSVAEEYLPFYDSFFNTPKPTNLDPTLTTPLDQLKNVFSIRPVDKDKNINSVIEDSFPDIMIYPNYFTGGVDTSSKDMTPAHTNWDLLFDSLDPESNSLNYTAVPIDLPFDLFEFERLQTPVKNVNYYEKLISKEMDKGVFEMDLEVLSELYQKRNNASLKRTLGIAMGEVLPRVLDPPPMSPREVREKLNTMLGTDLDKKRYIEPETDSLILDPNRFEFPDWSTMSNYHKEIFLTDVKTSLNDYFNWDATVEAFNIFTNKPPSKYTLNRIQKKFDDLQAQVPELDLKEIQKTLKQARVTVDKQSETLEGLY
tara:strand:+ start:470 stop:1888 length:1419 start_codon:yes stop_codon:yes gene_type:complete